MSEPDDDAMLIPADKPAPTTPEALAAELKSLLREGVTIAGLRTCLGILALPMTATRAVSPDPSDLAVSARSLIAEAASRVDGAPRGGALVTLGLAPGTQGTLLKQRRHEATKLLFLSSVDHFRTKREAGLITAVADELYALDATFRLRHRHRQRGDTTPHESRIGVDWLAQHRTYRRIWTPVCGMKNDLDILIELIRRSDDIRSETGERYQAVCDRLCNLTWFYARFQLQMERFVDEHGGLWLMSDPDAEVAVANAAYRLECHTPFGEADASWLRVLLQDSPYEELDPFVDRLVAARVSHPGFGGDLETRTMVLERGTVCHACTQEVPRRTARARCAARV